MNEYISKTINLKQSNEEESVVQCNDKQELINDDQNKLRKVPALAQLQIPLKPSVIKVIIKEVIILSNQFPNYNLLSYTNWGGSISQLLNIPLCKSKLSFDRMNRKRRFIDNLSKYIYSNISVEK